MNPHEHGRQHPPSTRQAGYSDVEEGRRYRYSDERERVGADGLPEYTDDESKRPRFNSASDANFERPDPNSRPSFRGRGPVQPPRSDDRLREEISDRLTWHEDVDASQITVQVASGEVTLEGTVPDRRTKRLAEQLAYDVRGVDEVHNHLRIAGNDAVSPRSEP